MARRLSFARWTVGVFALSVCLVTACNQQALPPTACTTLFAELTAAVRTVSGMPASGLAIRDSVRRTGRAFLVPQSLPLAPGSYVLLDDNFLAQVSAAGDSVQVTAASSSASTSAWFVFAAPGGCHVAKITGPDTLVLGP